MQSPSPPAAIWEMSPADLARLPGWGAGAKAVSFAPDLRAKLYAQAEREYQRLLDLGGRLLTWRDAAYPRLLAAIPDPPALLMIRGAGFDSSGPGVAMVGTRHPTAYGTATALRLARELAAAGMTIVSGLARGIDASAHQGALEAGGATWAVLGTGVDQVYPREHRALAERILQRGALISELPLGTGPQPHHFPERNRIISGFCRGVVVVEAGEQSGTLITVDSALSQGREVMAIPGPVTSLQSVGPHRLIRQGAALVTQTAEILQVLGMTSAATLPTVPAEGVSATAQVLLGWMANAPWRIDDLATATGLPVSEVMAELTLLELSGLTRTLSGGYVVRV